MSPDRTTIVLVEDNLDHATLVLRHLEKNKATGKVIHLTDGEAALKFFDSIGDDAGPALILLDLRLPRVDGLEVLRQVKSKATLQNIPVVILTTSSAEDDINRAYGFHANSYLVKPADFGQFRELMKDLGEYWLGWNKTPA
ncbi:MAG: response regulator [Leptospirales bacterium]|nr:response regulator [Leptospirales bacterium]